MDFDEFIFDLKKKIKKPLPGQTAQKLMAPMETDQSRFNFKSKSGAKEGAVLILFYPERDGVYFPLIQRSKYDGAHSGQIALPGGKVEDGDGHLFKTALREAKEEIGIEINDVSIVGPLTELYIPVSNFKVLPVIGYSLKKPQFLPDYHEVEEILLTNVEMLTDNYQQKIADIKIAKDFTIRAPYFAIKDKMVWGATAMMLGELRAVLQG